MSELRHPGFCTRKQKQEIEKKFEESKRKPMSRASKDRLNEKRKVKRKMVNERDLEVGRIRLGHYQSNPELLSLFYKYCTEEFKKDKSDVNRVKLYRSIIKKNLTLEIYNILLKQLSPVAR